MTVAHPFSGVRHELLAELLADSGRQGKACCQVSIAGSARVVTPEVGQWQLLDWPCARTVYVPVIPLTIL